MKKLDSSDFELFGLEPQFAQERAAIEGRWKDLQREAHPDKFAAQGAAAQRVAMQWSVRINEAYQRLKDPLKRAAYLCELRGAPINAEINTAMPAEFLMAQMAWREALDEASTEADLNILLQEIGQSRAQTLQRIGTLLDAQGHALEAAQQVRALMFVERFAQDVEAQFERLATP